MEKKKSSSELFESACQKLVEDPSYDRNKFLRLKGDKVQLLTLKPKFKAIAKKYIPHTAVGRTDRFPAELVVKISSIMGVYVNDITTLGMRR